MIEYSKNFAKISDTSWNYTRNISPDPITSFNKVNILCVLSFQVEEERTSFSEYYIPKVEIKDFNIIIDGMRFFVVPKKKKKTNIRKKIIDISKNNDYATGNLLEYEYFSNHYKLIAIDLNKNYKIIKS